ncbi:MAG TPA: FAD-dependent oxidoreductase [Methylovirgula sp.]|nr:FAD-dependent oxidoreductase [Methylovirgula sp.]
MQASFPKIRVIGAGIVGLTVAHEFALAGQSVEIIERADGPGRGCSFFAGGMLAPWCEEESAEPLVREWGREGLEYWTKIVPVAEVRGTLVVAPPRDRPDLLRFSRLTTGFDWLDRSGLADREPDLAQRFDTALFYPAEAHLDPRQAVCALTGRLRQFENVTFRFNTAAESLSGAADWIIDCRGYGARDSLADLRGVKGEMLVLATGEISLKRPVRLLHPRHPVYVVPRGDGRFMVGATVIENETRRVTARSILELLSAAYALHPAFGEAEIIEMGADLRPAFPDNLPRIRRSGRVVHVNGLYRHGFLLAPALARRTAAAVLKDAFFPEVMDEHRSERQTA